MKEKKKMSKGKKILLIVLAVFVVLAIAIGSGSNDAEPETTTTTVQTETTKEIPTRKESIGKSNKNTDEYLGSMKPSSFRNDSTGNWKITTVATSEDFREYAKDYYEKYFVKEASNEVHWIVNFSTNTTISVSCQSGVLSVNYFDYVSKEEHDAKVIGGGTPLGQYLVYLDNGDIEKL